MYKDVYLKATSNFYKKLKFSIYSNVKPSMRQFHFIAFSNYVKRRNYAVIRPDLLTYDDIIDESFIGYLFPLRKKSAVRAA